MKCLFTRAALFVLLTLGLHAAPPPQSAAQAAQNKDAPQAAGVPRLFKFNGILPATGDALPAGVVALRFAIYAGPQGGAPLWEETQNVQLDAQGRYAVILGAQREFPAEIFSSNDARWLGVQLLADGEPEQARVLLVSVPYALKAQDAETLGGRPASAYVLYESLSANSGLAKDGTGGGGQRAKSLVSGTVSTAVATTVNAIPKFSAADTLADSMMFEQYAQPAFDAFGSNLGYTEDVVRVGDGTGLAKRVQIAGRLVAEGFDVNTSAPNSVHVVNSNAGGFALQVNAVSQSTGFTNGIFATAQSSQAIGLAGWVFDALVPTVSGSQYTYGVWGQNANPTGAALFASHVYDGAGGATAPIPTGPIGIYASTAHSSAIPGVFDQRAASGTILSARFGGTEVVGVTTAGNLTASGTVTATSFSGSGASLTGVNAGDLSCVGCVGTSELSFDPATQAELDTHRSSSDHDARYVLKAGDTMTGTLSLPNLTASGTVTANSFSGSGASLTGVATSTQLSTLDARLAVRGINYIAGCDSCNLLQTTDSEKAIYMNVVGAMTINQVTCISDVGAPTINLQRDDGVSPANVLSADLACSTAGATTTGLAITTLGLNHKLDFYVTGGTGAAHRVTVVIKATVN